MIITARFWERLGTFEPNYKRRIEKKFVGENAKDCMNQIDDYKNYHDLAQYTEPEIINVED